MNTIFTRLNNNTQNNNIKFEYKRNHHNDNSFYMENKKNIDKKEIEHKQFLKSKIIDLRKKLKNIIDNDKYMKIDLILSKYETEYYYSYGEIEYNNLLK